MDHVRRLWLNILARALVDTWARIAMWVSEWDLMADGISPTMHGSRNFCQWGPNYDKVFFIVDEERDDLNTTKCGPLSARQQNAIENGVLLADWWWPNIECWLGSFVIFQGIRTSSAKKSYIFFIFQGGGSGPAPPYLDQCMATILYEQ